MGQTKIINKEQSIILDEIRNSDYLTSQFYFTGGTALSEVYLRHRESVDLDFFSKNKINKEAIFELVFKWSKKHKFIIEERFIEPVYRFNLKFKNGNVKIDFGHYPYRELDKKKKWEGISVDSLLDIAANKLFAISQRIEVKDFVDLYFLLKNFSVWDLIEGIRAKFNTKIDPYILATDFILVQDFEFLPKMLKPLTLEELKSFFINESKKLSKKSVE